jgi:hypothetical protein
LREIQKSLEDHTKSHENSMQLLKNLLKEKSDELERFKRGEESSIIDPIPESNCIKCEFS